jgi:glutathione-regulated potassium-efflux system ancillary protein KefG
LQGSQKSSQLKSSPPKVLLVVAHPDLEHSIVNHLMLKKVEDLSHVTVHDLYAHYPDFFIDVDAEHQLLMKHDIVVFQFPMFLYSCPSLLKEWMDRVLEKGFAYGEGAQLKGKKWKTVISTGGKNDAFSPDGYNQYTLNDFLRPFEMTAALCQMHWLEPMVLYWSHHVSDVERYAHAEDFRLWLQDPLDREERA